MGPVWPKVRGLWSLAPLHPGPRVGSLGQLVLELDASLLLYAANRGSPEHAQAVAFLETRAADTEIFRKDPPVAAPAEASINRPRTSIETWTRSRSSGTASVI